MCPGRYVMYVCKDSAAPAHADRHTYIHTYVGCRIGIYIYTYIYRLYNIDNIYIIGGRSSTVR